MRRNTQQQGIVSVPAVPMKKCYNALSERRPTFMMFPPPARPEYGVRTHKAPAEAFVRSGTAGYKVR